MPPEICPHCGAEVPPNAKACPECGSDEETGWGDEAQTQALDLPEENFNYDDYVEREFGKGKEKPHFHWFWWIIALGLLAAFLIMWLR
jgi:hypothetical protein